MQQRQQQQQARRMESVSPLEALGKLARKNSSRLAQSNSDGVASVSAWDTPSPSTSRGPHLTASQHRPPPLELSTSSSPSDYKGKQRAVESGGYGGRHQGLPQSWEQHQPMEQEVIHFGSITSSAPTTPNNNGKKLSPLRQHRFGDSISSTITDPFTEYSDDPDSPIDRAHSIHPPSRAISNASPSQSYRSTQSSDTFGAGGGGAFTTRGPAGRQAQSMLANPDDVESLQGDRSTWHTDGGRDSVATLMGEPSRLGKPRESTLTLGSNDGDPFAYSAYETLPSPSSNGFHDSPASPQSAPISIPIPPSQYDVLHSALPLTAQSPPIVRIGPPSPRTSASFFASDPPPNDARAYFSGASESPLSHSARSEVSSGRAPSQTFAKNYSRPLQPMPRSQSLDSMDGREQDSSVDHSSQAHSMSSSWENRNEFEHHRYLSAHQQHAAYVPEASIRVVQPDVDYVHPYAQPHASTPPPNFQPSPVQPYSPVIRGPPSNSTPHAFRDAEEEEDAQSQYRIDSYYGAPSRFTLPATPFSREELEEERKPKAQQSGGSSRQRNVLRKPKPPPQSSPSLESGSRWGLFKSASQKGRPRQSRDVGEAFTKPEIQPPMVSFPGQLPPPELGVDPDKIAARAYDDDGRQPTFRQASPRMGSGFNSPSMSSGRSPFFQSPQLSHSETMERLDDRSAGLHHSASDSVLRRPPPIGSDDRPGTSHSAYSNYSYYTLPPDDSGYSHSPAASHRSSPNSTHAPPHVVTFASHTNVGPSTTISKAKASMVRKEPIMTRSPSGNLEPRISPRTPDDFLQLAIILHEEGELERAAWYFEQSATLNGGCGAGMLMWGLTLRHGWGCPIDANLGFQYLQGAAESVVRDLDRVVAGNRRFSKAEMDTSVVRNELVLALYELGTSFRFGWGTTRDKKMAVAYFELAANLGDPDAQRDLAFCYANGKGCKKDLKKAAKYYRMAVAQGGETFGLSWIYKPKYMED